MGSREKLLKTRKNWKNNKENLRKMQMFEWGTGYNFSITVKHEGLTRFV
jgi:hypothetical protein